MKDVLVMYDIESALPVKPCDCILWQRGVRSIWSVGVLWSLELYLKTLHTNLEPVHCLNGCLG